MLILHSSPYAALNQFRENSEQSKHQDDLIKLNISNLELYQNLIVAIFWCYIGQFVLSLSLLLLYFVRQSRHRLIDFLPAPSFLLLKLLTAGTLLVSVRFLYSLLTNALKNETTKLLQDGSQTAREQLQNGTECCDILLSNNERSRIDGSCHHSKEVPTCTEMFIGIFDGQRATFIIFFILHTVVLFKYCSIFVKRTQSSNNDQTPSGEDQLQLFEQNGQAQQQPRTVSSGQENTSYTPAEERAYSLTETVNRDRMPKAEVTQDGNRGTQIISGPIVPSGMRFHSEVAIMFCVTIFALFLLSKKAAAQYYDVVVVGGELAGMMAAYKLKQFDPDIKIIVLEESDRVGGRRSSTVFSANAIPVHVDDILTELGIGGMNVAVETIVERMAKSVEVRVNESASSAVATNHSVLTVTTFGVQYLSSYLVISLPSSQRTNAVSIRYETNVDTINNTRVLFGGVSSSSSGINFVSESILAGCPKKGILDPPDSERKRRETKLGPEMSPQGILT
uniref:Uncharacterized protein n=1 Tax=Plectus sambesii TaxID=2011161 RepID=A0A914V3W0_9BILA